MKLLRILGFSIAAITITATVWLGIALWVYRDIPAGVLEAQYATHASRFINIDGARIHFRDEGDGPAVLLLHADFGNLVDWDPWADALQDTYRVVRLDFTSHGLSGPDASGDYSLERTLELTEKFVDALNLEKFSIAGTSIGGTIAILFAVKHPERIENLILPSPQLPARKIQIGRLKISDSAYALKYVMPRALTKFVLASGFADKTNLSDELIDRWHNLWMREGQREAQLDRLKQYKAGDIESALYALQPRTLLLWGEADTTVDFAQAAEFQGLLENVASLQVISYPGVGHMTLHEAGTQTGHDVRAFLDQGLLAADDTPGPGGVE